MSDEQLILAIYLLPGGVINIKWSKPAYDSLKARGLLLNVAQVLHDHADALERLEDVPKKPLGPVLVQ